MAEPFATSADLEARYRVSYVDDDDQSRVDVLLGAASRLVRQRLPGIDSRAGLDPELVKDVVCEMVWIAVSAPTPGVTQQTSSIGGVSRSSTFEGASGRIYLGKAQMDLLRPARARARAGYVNSLPASYEPAGDSPSDDPAYVSYSSVRAAQGL